MDQDLTWKADTLNLKVWDSLELTDTRLSEQNTISAGTYGDNKWELTKLKSFYMAKDTVIQKECKPVEWK